VRPVLVDTGFLVSIYDKHEPRHGVCLRVHAALPNPLVTCEAVVAESLHLLRRTPEAADGILASVEAGILQVPFQLLPFAGTVRTILRKYRDTPADFADACLIHMANELNTGDILTLDSDFKHYRWRRTRHFHMLIPMD
jgi:predicted nucleic acid-binding protein